MCGSSQSAEVFLILSIYAFASFFGARTAGYRAIVASTPISTYGVEAPAARAHGARFERYVGRSVYGLVPCLVPLQCRFLVTPCMEEAPRLQAHISRHTQAFRKADFFYTLPQSPFGCVHFSSTYFLRPSSQRLIVSPEVSAKGSSQTLSIDNFCSTSGGLRQNMSGHELEFT
jgi:hypothetical protein